MQTLDIISRHETLAEAVAASGLDLSYNPEEAAKTIARTDRYVREAFVVPGGVVYLYETPGEGLCLLNKFSPFCMALDSYLFCPVTIAEEGHGAFEKGLITIGDPCFNRSPQSRRVLAESGITVTTGVSFP